MIKLIRSLLLRFLTNPVLIAFSLSLAILVVRCLERLQYATLWAEDGTIYFNEVYADPVGSIAHPFAGYYQIFPRLLAYFAYLYVPVASLPFFASIAALIFYSMCIALFAGKGYRWVIPSTGIRVFTVVTFSLLPGLNEIAGNIVNLTGFFMFFLALVFLKDFKTAYNPAEYILCILAIFTQGGCILFLPALCMRSYLRYRYMQSAWGIWQEIVIATAIILASALAFSTGGSIHNPKTHDLLQYILVEIRTILALFVMYPWTGDLTKEFMSIVAAPYLVRFAVGYLRWYSQEHRLLFYSVLAGVLAYPLLTFLVRVGSSGAYSGGIGTAEFHNSRYSYLLPAFGLVFWVSILMRIPVIKNSRRFIPALFLFAFCALAVTRFSIPAHENHSAWKANLEELNRSESTGCPRQVTVPISPPGWSFTYISPKGIELQRKGQICP